MTLQDKFHKWLKTEPFGSRERPTLREAMCEEIAEEFAIEFAQWTRDMGYCHYHSYAHSYKELLEMFKKQKEL